MDLRGGCGRATKASESLDRPKRARDVAHLRSLLSVGLSPITNCLNRSYSARNTPFGSTRAPRIAGIMLAMTATRSSAPVTVPKTTGSRAD